eukprot:3566545-Alexandrium_andersonii.AAC.1
MRGRRVGSWYRASQLRSNEGAPRAMRSSANWVSAEPSRRWASPRAGSASAPRRGVTSWAPGAGRARGGAAIARRKRCRASRA